MRKIFLPFLLFLGSDLFGSDSAFIRNPLQAVPPGEWVLSAVLSTQVRGEEKSSFMIPGEQTLTIHVSHEKNGTRQVTYRSNGTEGIRVSVPQGGKVKMVDLATNGPVQDMGKHFLGSAFTMEDVSMSFLSWPSKLVGEETLKDRSCWKKVGYSPKSGVSAYARVESWIDQEYDVPLKILAYDSDGNLLKEFKVRSFQQLEETWMLKNLELNVPAESVRSRLEILDAKKKS